MAKESTGFMAAIAGGIGVLVWVGLVLGFWALVLMALWKFVFA